jgi:predicted nuclease with TOPRIM domain
MEMAMSNTENVTHEILKSIQKSIASLEQKIASQDDKFTHIEMRFDVLDNKFDNVEHWTTHSLGVSSMAKAESTIALATANAAMKKLDSK